MDRKDNRKALGRRGDQDFHHGLEPKEWPAPWFQGFASLFSAEGLRASSARQSAASLGLSQSS